MSRVKHEVSALFERERNARAQQRSVAEPLDESPSRVDFWRWNFLAHAKQARFNAQVTEWLMVADCKSAALRSYGGSNPPLCTRLFFSASCKCKSASVFMWHSRFTQF